MHTGIYYILDVLFRKYAALFSFPIDPPLLVYVRTNLMTTMIGEEAKTFLASRTSVASSVLHWFRMFCSFYGTRGDR